MKKNLFLSRILSVLTVTAVTLGSMSAFGGTMHSDIGVMTYTDFGQNRGRYVTGNAVSSLLQHIRTEEGGIGIHNLRDGSTHYIGNDQGMINFSGTFDNGALGMIGPNISSTVGHNGPNNASFGHRTVGENAAINYSAIHISGSSVFQLWVGPDMGTNDLALQRQSKIATDANWYAPSTMFDEANPTFAQNFLAYTAGGGTMKTYDAATDTTSGAMGAYQYIAGGINRIDEMRKAGEGASFDANISNDTGASATADPMPYRSNGGDSGSSYYVYNTTTGQYEYLGALYGGNESSYSRVYTAQQWTRDKLSELTQSVDMDSTNTVYLNAVATQGEVKTDGTNTTTLYTGTATDGTNTLATYRGTQTGNHTWSDLSGEKDKDNWYAYGEGYLQRSDADLFFTDNLKFTGSGEKVIQLNDTVDLGIGYAEFNGGKFTIQSESGEINEFNHAGYVINEGAEVHLKLVNNSDHMTEWRKTGAGNLWIDGSGDTNALLNVGGSGTTYLNQQGGGYAAYNVLINTGATVQITGGTSQIKRDVTFGSGGGTLDLAGHDHTWNNDGTSGFTIHALTDEATISNSAASTATLTVTKPESTYKGSFAGNLNVVYQGSDTWTLNSIHTHLADGHGLDVQSGKVILQGTNTVHAMGSATGTSKDRLSRDNDWHYADAKMDVQVSGGTFELGSHARLTGDVNVTSGTYIMREGVKHDREYVEGGVYLEDVSKYAGYYGHKGDINLASGTNLQIEYNSGVTAHNEYGGNISGSGNVSVALGNDGASLRLSGDNTAHTGTKTLSSGILIAEDTAALGDTGTNKWQVGVDGFIGVEAAGTTAAVQNVLNTAISGTSTGTIMLTDGTYGLLNMDAHQNMFIGAMEGAVVNYGSASDVLKAQNGQWLLGGGGGTLNVHALLTGDNNLILGSEHAGGTVYLTNADNDFTGTVTMREGITLIPGSNMGNATIQLNYTNRVLGVEDSSFKFFDDANGILLVDNIATGEINMSGSVGVALGAQKNTTLTGSITGINNAAYRFGGLDCKLTVETVLSGDNGLIVDGHTYSGGEICLAQQATLTGDVEVKGYDSGIENIPQQGDITLSFGVDHALASAASVTAKDGATINLAGTDQSFKSLTVESGAVVTDSAETGGSLSVSGSGNIAGHVTVESLALGSNSAIADGSKVTTTNFSMGSGSVADGSLSTTNLTKTGEGELNIYARNVSNTFAGDVSVQGGTLHLQGKNDITGSATIAAGATLKISDANLVENGYTRTSLNNLSGSGTLIWQKNQGAHEKSSRLTLTGESQFSGSIEANRVNQWNNSRPYTSFLEIADNNAAKGATISLNGRTNYNYAYMSMAVGADNASIAGLNGNGRTALVSGAAPEASYDVTSSANNTLTITGSGNYTFSGTVIGDATNALSVVMNGTGSQSFNGSTTPLNDGTTYSAFRDVTAKQGTLSITATKATVHGNVAVARGANLKIGDSFALNEGKTFTVLAAENGSTATANFNSTLTLNGGSLVFDGAALSEDAAALHLGGLSGDSANIAFNNTSFLKTDTTYLLSDGNWSGIGISGTGSSYLTPTFSGSADSLSVSFAIKDGCTLWYGTDSHTTWDADTFAQDSGIGSNVAVFNDSAAVKVVEVSGAVEAVRIIFDSTQDYTFNGTGSISAGSLDITATGRMEVNTEMSITGALSLVDGAVLATTGTVSADNISLGEGASLAASAAITANSLDMEGDATLSLSGTSEHSIGSLNAATSTLSLENTALRLGNSSHSIGRLDAAAGELIVSGTLNLGNDAHHIGALNAESCTIELGNGSLNLGSAEHSIGTLNAGNASVSMNGGTLHLAAGTSNIKTLTAGAESNVSLGSGATLNRINTVTGTVSLTGSGIYKLGAGKTTFADSGSLALHATDWTGTVELTSDVSTTNALDGLNLNTYGNAGSTVKLLGVLGSLMDAREGDGVTFASKLNLVNNSWAALELNKGNEGDKFTFAGAISGNGNFVKNNTASQSFTFSGDVSGWNGGNYRVVTGENNLTFSGNATTINLAKIYTENNAAGTTTVTFSNANAVAVNSIIQQGTNSTLNVVADAAGGTTFSKNVTVGILKGIRGAINLNGESNNIGTLDAANSGVNIGGSKTLSLGAATHNIGALNAGNATVSMNGGTLNLGTGTSSIKTLTAAADSNVSLGSDATLNRINTVNGTVKLTGAGTYKLGGGKTTFADSGSLSLHATDWTGTVELTSAENKTNVLQNLDLNTYGNACSTVKLTGVLGSLMDAGEGDGVTFTSNLNLQNNNWAALELNAGNDGDKFTFAGAISGNGNFVKNNTVSQSFTFSGDVSGWNGGNYRVVTGENNLTFSGNATTINLAKIYTENAAAGTTTVTFSNANAVTVNSIIQQGTNSTLNVVADAAGGTTFSKNATVGILKGIRGAINLNGESNNIGTLDAANSGVNIGGSKTLSLGAATHNIGALNAGNATVSMNGGTLNLGTGTSSIKTLTAGAESNVSLGSGATLNRINTVTGTVSLTGSGIYKLGAGKTTFADSGSLALHATDWTGAVELTSAVNTANALHGLNLNTYGNAGSTVKLLGVLGSLMDAREGDGVTFASKLNLVNNSWAALELNAGNEGDKFTFTGAISGNGNFVKNNTASQSFTFSGDVSGWNGGNYRVVTGENNLTFSGNATTINLAKIYTENNAAGTTTVTFSNANAVTVNSIIQQGSNSTLNVVADAAGGTTFNKFVTVNNLTLSKNAEFKGGLSVSGAIDGEGALIKGGNDTLTVSGTNDYSGGTIINGGVLKLGSAKALGSGSVTVNAGGTLDVNGAKDTEYVLTLADAATLKNSGNTISTGTKQIADITLTGNATVTGSSDFAMVASGHAKASLDLGGNTLTKTGSNTFTISNAEVTAGTLKVTQGTLQAMKQSSNDYLDISAATVEVGRVAEGNVGTFRLSGNSEAIAALKLDGGTVTVDNGHRLTVSGAAEVSSQGGSMTGMVQINGGVTVDAGGSLAIGNGTDNGLIIQNRNNEQQGAISNGIISSNGDNTSISIAGAGADNRATLNNTLLDIMAGCTLQLEHVVLNAGSRITDAPATLNVNDVVANVAMGANDTTATTASIAAGTSLEQFGNAAQTLNVGADANVLHLESSLMDTVTVTGTSLTINFSGLGDISAYDYVSITFTDGSNAAAFDTGISITATYEGESNVALGYYITSENSTANETSSPVATVYFEAAALAVPEPTTATLSLLALAALAARRRRK